MRALIQRVLHASVAVEGRAVSHIGPGLLVFVGVHKNDSPKDVEWLAEKVTGLRVFTDQHGKMNLSVADVHGELLVVSQFTLYGDCRKGKRPSFVDAATPSLANELYELLCANIRKRKIKVGQGIFQADMQVTLTNDGPVTISLETPS